MAIVGVQKSFSHVGFSGGSSPSQFNHVGFGSHDSFQSAAVAPPFGRKRMVLGSVMAGLMLLATSCFNPSKPASTQSEGETLTTQQFISKTESKLGPKGTYLISFIKNPDGAIAVTSTSSVGKKVAMGELPASASTDGKGLLSLFEKVLLVQPNP